MKKLFIALVLLSSTANATVRHYNNIDNYPKAVEFYKRFDSTKQPYVWKSSTKGIDLLMKVNKEVNHRIVYQNERAGRDYWQTPEETNKLHMGDCEDFAFTKWYELLQNGFPEENMWLLQGVEKSTNSTQHATLQVLLDDKFYYLDNETDDITVNNIKVKGSYILNRFGVTYYFED